LLVWLIDVARIFTVRVHSGVASKSDDLFSHCPQYYTNYRPELTCTLLLPMILALGGGCTYTVHPKLSPQKFGVLALG